MVALLRSVMTPEVDVSEIKYQLKIFEKVSETRPRAGPEPERPAFRHWNAVPAAPL